MGDDKKKVSFEGEVDLGAVQDYLKELGKGLKAGSIWIQSGNGILGLTPPDTVTMTVEGKRKKDRQKLTVELEWEQSAEEAPEAQESLVISADEPEPVIVEESD